MVKEKGRWLRPQIHIQLKESTDGDDVEDEAAMYCERYKEEHSNPILESNGKELGLSLTSIFFRFDH